jgi:hypothetical protein
VVTASQLIVGLRSFGLSSPCAYGLVVAYDSSCERVLCKQLRAVPVQYQASVVATSLGHLGSTSIVVSSSLQPRHLSQTGRLALIDDTRHARPSYSTSINGCVRYVLLRAHRDESRRERQAYSIKSHSHSAKQPKVELCKTGTQIARLCRLCPPGDKLVLPRG